MLSEIIGHDLIKKKLIKRLEKGPFGTYLFYGPPSVGKRTTAFESAKVVLCKKKSEKKCKCDSCKRFDLSHPDFMCIGQQEKIKVADVDRIIDFFSLSPFLSDGKIAVIDNAHEITVEASNRLLKTLEEPPDNFGFFLVSSKPELIMPTVLSRCIRFKFDSLSREQLEKVLIKKMGFKPAKAKILAVLAEDSSMEVFSRAGQYLKYRDMAFDFISGIKSNDLINSLDYVDKIPKSDLPLFIDMAMIILTDLLLLKNNISIINEDLIKNMERLVNSLNDKALVGITGMFSQIKKHAYLNVNLNINIKNVLIKSHPLFQVAK